MDLKALQAFSENKVILITGKDGCGKSLLAKSIIGDNQVSKIDGRVCDIKTRFIYQNVTDETNVFFIDDVVNSEFLTVVVYRHFEPKISIDRKCKPVVEIDKLITVITLSDACKIPLCSSFRRRVKIINID